MRGHGGAADASFPGEEAKEGEAGGLALPLPSPHFLAPGGRGWIHVLLSALLNQPHLVVTRLCGFFCLWRIRQTPFKEEAPCTSPGWPAEADLSVAHG